MPKNSRSRVATLLWMTIGIDAAASPYLRSRGFFHLAKFMALSAVDDCWQ
jgi:hypothetical protein